jgi:glycolate oxidase
MINELREFLKSQHPGVEYTSGLIDLVSYSTDASTNQNRPLMAVWPTSTGQISGILAFCNERGIPVTARGAGTGLTGMAVPIEGGIVLDLCRMNRIKKLSIADRLAVVEPGVVFGDLAKALAPHGFCFPPDPSSGIVATLGGNVATNAGGLKGAKYGTTKDYVLGLEVVLANGQVMRTGGKTLKTSSGYNLTQLFVGSEGTLGVISEITLKINPLPTVFSTAMASFDNVEDAGRAITGIMQSGILPAVLEIMDRATIKAVSQYSELELPQCAAMILVETDGFTKGETEYQLDKVLGLFKANQASSIRKAGSQQERMALWKARKAAYGGLANLNNTLLVEDLAVPMSKVAPMLKFVEELSLRYGLTIATAGHAGDGNLHPTICFDGANQAEAERAHQAAAELFDKIIEFEGTLTGEHGIGLDKAPLLHTEHDAEAMAAMGGLKNYFDPNHILNPGKMALTKP